MDTVMETNIIQEPKYQDIKDIETEYDGYCVCIIKGRGKPSKLIGGEVIGYGKSVAKLGRAVYEVIDRENSGLVVFKSYTKFGDISVIQVVPYEN
jgi:hypothetical protein